MQRITDEKIEQILAEAKYIINTESTVRETAKVFNVSKSTVHTHCTSVLKRMLVNQPQYAELYDGVRGVMEKHLDTRHLARGQATRLKFLKLSKQRDENMERFKQPSIPKQVLRPEDDHSC